MEQFNNLENSIISPVHNLESLITKESIEALRARMVEIEMRENELYKMYGQPVGDSSFMDVFKNRISACKSDLRHVADVFSGEYIQTEDDEPVEDIFKSLNFNMGYTERYLGLLETYPEFSKAEFGSKGGMFPNFSEEADKAFSEGKKINRIDYYIEESEKKLKSLSQA